MTTGSDVGADEPGSEGGAADAGTPADPGRLVDQLGRGLGHALFDGLGDLVIVLAPDLTIEYANPVTAELLGGSPDALIGRPMVELVHPDDLARGVTAVRRAGSRQTTPAVPGVFRVRHDDGSWREIELSAGRVGSPSSPRTVLVGRVNHDPAIYHRLLGLLTRGTALAEVMEVVPAFGAWREPDLPFAVAYDGPALARQVVGRAGGVDLLRALVAARPWGDREPDDGPLRGRVADLPAAALVVAVDHGVSRWVAQARRSPHGGSGALVVGWTTPDGPNIGTIERSVGLMARALDFVLGWHEQRQALELAARTDAVTGLVDRATFVDAVATALERAEGAPVGVLEVDLHGLRDVAHTLGHAAADRALVEAVRRIAAVMRPGGVLARDGARRLAIVCSGLDASVAAEALAHAVVAGVSAPMICADRTVELVVNVGVALTAHHQTTPVLVDDLLVPAEVALDRARGAGAGRVVVAPGVGGLGLGPAGVDLTGAGEAP